MVKHKARGKSFAAKRFEGENTLGTLANATAAVQGVEATTGDAFYLISLDVYAYMRGHTAGEGPIAVGIMHGGYTNTHIKEWYEAGDAWGRDNPVVSVEQNNRMIREIGVFSGLDAEEALFDGRARRIKCGFVIPNGVTLDMWAYNRDSGALTTGSIVGLHGKAYIRWV